LYDAVQYVSTRSICSGRDIDATVTNLTTHELDAPPWLRVESTLMATARLLRVAFDARLAALDLNLTQASLLGYVSEFGATTQSDLADHLGIGRAAIGSVVDHLEARGLVERRPKPEDRRVWLVAITEPGTALAQRIAEVDEVLRAELRHGIGREERQALAWVMTRLQQNLATAIATTPHHTTAMSDTPISGDLAHRAT
jgi:MarR family transcriptional regulator, transcriptional regulator for hemolysin